MNKIFEEKRYIEIDDCDLNFNMKISEMIKIAEQTSMHHATKFNLGKAETFDKGFGWIVSRIKLDIKKFPTYGETLTIKTKAFPVLKTLYPRKVYFFNSKKEELVSITMLWHLLDYKNGTLTELPSKENYYVDEEFSLSDFPRSIKIENENFEYVASKVVTYMDMDFNKHLNNIKYIEYSLGKEPSSFNGTSKIKSVIFQFVEQVKENEEIIFLKQKQDNGAIKYIGKKKDKIVFKMEATF